MRQRLVERYDELPYEKEKGDVPMTTWTSDDLTKIGTAEELEIAPRRPDGTLHNLVTIWVVRLNGDLY